MSVTKSDQVKLVREMEAAGRQLIVIRPEDAPKAIARAQQIAADQAAGRITGRQASEQMQAMLGEQPYRVAGYPVERNGEVRLIDLDGTDLGTMQNGDSFVEPQPVKHQ